MDVAVYVHIGDAEKVDAEMSIYVYARHEYKNLCGTAYVENARDVYPDARYVEFDEEVVLEVASEDIRYPNDLVDPVIYTTGRHVAAVVTDDAIYLPDFAHYDGDRETNCAAYAKFVNSILDTKGDNWKTLLATELTELSTKHDNVTVVRAEVEMDVEEFIRSAIRSVDRMKGVVQRRCEIRTNELSKELDKIKDSAMSDALKIVSAASASGFVFMNSGVLKHTGGRIRTQRAIYHSVEYEVEDEMWIDGLKVQIDRDGRMTGASCHRSNHPNAEGRVVCIGTLHGKSVTVIGELIDALRMPNVNSCYRPDYWEPLMNDSERIDSSTWSE
jgi:hypothetical protein